MHAILISDENRSEIEAHNLSLPEREDDVFDYTIYQNRTSNWYYVSGYVSPTGEYVPWVTMPEYILRQDFEYDPFKIETDWDQIVRK